MTVAEVAGWVTLASSAVAVGSLCYLHLVRTGLSPLRDAVSRYGISEHRAWYRAQTVAYGVAGLALALGLDRDLRGAKGAGLVVALVALFGLCRLVISWVPMDAPGRTPTSRGAAHGLLALVTFLSIVVAGIRLCHVLDVDAAFDALGSASRVLGWLGVGLLALLVLSRLSVDLRRGFGLVERGVYVVFTAWLVLVGAACATGHLGAFHP